MYLVRRAFINLTRRFIPPFFHSFAHSNLRPLVRNPPWRYQLCHCFHGGILLDVARPLPPPKKTNKTKQNTLNHPLQAADQKHPTQARPHHTRLSPCLAIPIRFYEYRAQSKSELKLCSLSYPPFIIFTLIFTLLIFFGRFFIKTVLFTVLFLVNRCSWRNMVPNPMS